MSTNMIRTKAIEAGLKYFDNFARGTRTGKNAKVRITLYNVHPTKVGEHNELRVTSSNFFISHIIGGMMREMNHVLNKAGLSGDFDIDIQH